tara:strand:+ start:943 stop:4389 length:3447 start_codon:yes stop_codon:yes gene_type:complete
MALNSTSTIHIADLICEGPISDIVGGLEGVFLDETAIQTDGVNNFEEGQVNVNFYRGGTGQNYLPQAWEFASSIVQVGQEIGENYSEELDSDGQVISRDYGPGSIVRQVTDTEVDTVRLLFTIPRLYSTAMEGLARGQLFNGVIEIRVQVQSEGSAYNDVWYQNVTGVSIGGYQFQTGQIELPGEGPWNIRCEKINLGERHFEVSFENFDDVDKNTSLQSGRANQIIWETITEVKQSRVSYKYSAVAGLSLSSKSFSSLPTRAYKVRGLYVSVPNNATPRTDGSLSFAGTFNGGLKSAWTTCPVCCWYDMLTNKRYGAGDFVQASNVSWIDLYPLAQYANQLVTNPDGTTEARFACNTVIGSQAEAFNVLQDLASVFRGMLYWQANTIQATADHGNLDGSDITPVHLYTNSNVVSGAFNYSGTSLKTRSTSIRVRYNDPENFYKSNYVVVEDAELINKYGYQDKEVVAFGTTSKYQAQRLGRWMLASEELDGEVVTFVSGLDGAVVLPGQVFEVADEMRQGARLSGRVNSASYVTVDGVQSVQITTDQEITSVPGDFDTLTLILPDGKFESQYIKSVSGKTIIADYFTALPLEQALWAIDTTSVAHQKFRCLTVADKGDGQYTITGVEHNDSIYRTADQGTDLEFQDITLYNDTPGKPENLTLEGREIVDGRSITTRVIASWRRADALAVSFEIRYKLAGGNYVTDEVTSTIYEIDNLDQGKLLTFEVRAVGVSPLYKKSAWVSATITTPSPDIDPNDPNGVVRPPIPANVTIEAVGDLVILRWEIPPTALDFTQFKAIIRHSSKLDGTGTWADSVLLGEVAAINDFASLPLIEGEYLVKFESASGQRSFEAASAVIDLPNPIPRFDVQVVREDQQVPPFQGEKDDVLYNEEYDGLVLDGAEEFDAVLDVDALSTFDFIGIRFESGEYYFRDILDLGGVYSVVFTRLLTTRGLYPANTMDDRAALINTWSDFDGDIPDDTSARVYFRTSDEALVDAVMLLEDGDSFLLEDGTDKIEMELDLDFGDTWTPMESGRYTGRQFQFKCELTSKHIDQTPLVDELGYTMQLEQRTESSDTIASGAASKAVAFTNPFYQVPSIGITAFNLASGDYYVVTSTARTGFTITFYDSSNAAIDRNFTYQAVGYGSEQI